jgi:hypothetical protein
MKVPKHMLCKFSSLPKICRVIKLGETYNTSTEEMSTNP